MADKLPLVLNTNGVIEQLQSSDTLVGIPVVITSPTTVYVSTTGNDTTGDGTSGSPYQTFDKAWDIVKDWILQDAVTISIEAGDYRALESGNLILDHQQGSKVSIAGDYATDTPTHR
jgi:hypothetical protein